MSYKIVEGDWGFDAGSLYYPEVSSCLTVSIINANLIYGFHGVISFGGAPIEGKSSIALLIRQIKDFKPISQDAKMIIVTDYNTWGRDGRYLQIYANLAGVTDFDTMADYIGIKREGKHISGPGRWYGNVKFKDVGPDSPYFNSVQSSASFLVDINGNVNKA